MSKIKKAVRPEPKKFECKRCGHVWYTRLNYDPLVCPMCKSHKYKEAKDEKD